VALLLLCFWPTFQRREFPTTRVHSRRIDYSIFLQYSTRKGKKLKRAVFPLPSGLATSGMKCGSLLLYPRLVPLAGYDAGEVECSIAR